MKNQIVYFDIGALMDTLYTDLPAGLRQIADAIETGRMSGKCKNHLTHGLCSGFGVRLVLEFYGHVVTTEQAPEMLESGQ